MAIITIVFKIRSNPYELIYKVRLVPLYWAAVVWGRVGWNGTPDCRKDIDHLLGISNPKEEITLPATKYLKPPPFPWYTEWMLIEKKLKSQQSENSEILEGATALTG